MHIKKLEIAGFKSFVDRTVIHFDHDVIGIVGPNGCGKSNIVDSIRWCMGEQSAKHLRGRAMEDVIFNGSESRGPHGFAEVTLTFDNNDSGYAASLPDTVRDFPEIAVTRRLFRDGTSEYLLNKTQVRLRDITELFLGTGVGTKAYSIVEQGRIGQIVSARPQDRRLFIEEAAGITKYKQRRKQAERKMDLTRQNLLRISDIVAEIDRTRASLRRQAAKAERYIQYRAELEQLVLHDSAHRLLEMTVLERVERDGLGKANSEAASTRDKLEASEAELERARLEGASIEERADNASRSAFEADNEVSGLAGEIERAKDRLAHLDERDHNAEREHAEVIEQRQQLSTERQQLLARIAELESTERDRAADTEAENDALAELQGNEAEAVERVEKLRGRVGEIRTQAATAEARLEASLTRAQEGAERSHKLQLEQQALTTELGSLRQQQVDIQPEKERLHDAAEEARAAQQGTEGKLKTLRERLSATSKDLDQARRQLGQLESRRTALEDIRRRREGVDAGARALVTGDHPGVLGLLADRVSAPTALTAALAAAAGERLQAVVVDSTASALETLKLLEGGAGRATLIPARPPFVAGRGTLPEGGICWLQDRLSYSSQDEALMASVFGRVVLVRDAAAGIEALRQDPTLTAVTSEGTLVRADGSIRGGAGDTPEAALLEQQAQLTELEAQVGQADAQVAALEGQQAALRTQRNALELELEELRQRAHGSELAQLKAEQELTRLSREIEGAQRRSTKLDAELAELTERVAKANAEQAEHEELLAYAQNELTEAQAALESSERDANAWKEKVAAQSSLLTERKVRLAQVREQAEAARITIERLERSLEELASRAERLDADVLECARSFGETVAHMMMARESRVGALGRASAAHKELDEARTLLEQVRHALATKEAELKELRDELALLDEATQKHTMALQRMEIEKDHLLEGVRSRFQGLDLQRVVGDYHKLPPVDEAHRRRIDELTKLIDRMGPVNLDAKEEYADAEKRFAELNDQKVDIEDALDELVRAIRHMDKESRRRFKETYDHVNELFKHTFKKLFRGGQGQLRLTDPDNLLETGVEILAQPPGKKLSNLELMSGGEKALTATALIFAMFQHRPSPFCVLDEVDAPLDEANVGRYCEMIRAMTHRSQFILITHIKKTMQSVDVLYGVTMGEPGVSRIVSVKVNDEATSRSEKKSALAPAKAPAPTPEQQAEEQVLAATGTDDGAPAQEPEAIAAPADPSAAETPANDEVSSVDGGSGDGSAGGDDFTVA